MEKSYRQIWRETGMTSKILQKEFFLKHEPPSQQNGCEKNQSKLNTMSKMDTRLLNNPHFANFLILERFENEGMFIFLSIF